ncbi:MAG: glutamate--tRNA ligase [Myxococcota bacterium]
MTDRPVRVRIAPSPTGDPHVGTAYIGLFNYAFAKKHGGKFILRIEDTDQTRSSKESEQMIFDALKWVGLQYDEGPDVGGPFGPYRQSERLPLYRKEAEALLASGKAYRCTCTPERLEALREEQKRNKQNPGYDGFCRDRDPKEVEKEVAEGRAWVIRLKVPRTGVTVVEDKLRGRIEFENKGIDDQVLLKSDGFPTYHLANVVDDRHMQITHVIRGEEWITSTPKHVLLYEAFGWQPPEFCHMPLLRNADKSKVSKRKNPTSIMFYKRVGIVPEALLNFLALMGWTMPDAREIFSVQDMIQHLDLTRISLGGPVFDLAKLNWVNEEYLRKVFSEEEFLTRLKQTVFADDYLRQIIPLVRERISRFEDFIGYGDFFFNGSVIEKVDVKTMVPKGRTLEETATALAEIVEIVDKQTVWNKTELEKLMRAYGDEKGWKAKDLFMPVRVAVTGKTATPPLFESMEVLGKEQSRRRLREAVAAMRAQPAQQPGGTPPATPQQPKEQKQPRGDGAPKEAPQKS